MQEAVKTREDLSRELKDAYDRLPYNIRMKVRDELLEAVDWSQPLFYFRINGRRLIRKIEIPVIKGVFARYGVAIFE